MPRILLTHPAEARAQYYGARALGGLRALADVVTNPLERALTADELIAAARGCDIILSDRQTPGVPEVFETLPGLVAFMRCAVDIRNVDVAAASRAGVLVTHASAGFVAAVTELAVGFMVDLARGLSAAAADYRAGRKPAVRMGVQLAGGTLGVIGYGAIGRNVAAVGHALGMQVLVTDPHAAVDRRDFEQTALEPLLAQADFVVCAAIANEATENLIGWEAFAKMKPTAYFVNISRGNLVDEAALARALDERLIAGCALDVGRAPDQMPSPGLAARADVIATPHIGGLTPPAIEHQALETVAQAAEILAGRVPRGAANADHASRLAALAAESRQPPGVQP